MTDVQFSTRAGARPQSPGNGLYDARGGASSAALAGKFIRHGYADAFMALAGLRTQIENTLQAMVDILDALDAPGEGLEPAGDEEPSLGAPEAVTANDGPASAVRKPRRYRMPTLADVYATLGRPLAVDRACDQSDWARGDDASGDDREADASDDEPSLGSLDQGRGQLDWDWRIHSVGPVDREQDAGDEPEEENEHGAEDDGGEHTLGWCEGDSQADLGPNTPDEEHSLGAASHIDQRLWADGHGDDPISAPSCPMQGGARV